MNLFLNQVVNGVEGKNGVWMHELQINGRQITIIKTTKIVSKHTITSLPLESSHANWEIPRKANQLNWHTFYEQNFIASTFTEAGQGNEYWRRKNDYFMPFYFRHSIWRCTFCCNYCQSIYWLHMEHVPWSRCDTVIS